MKSVVVWNTLAREKGPDRAAWDEPGDGVDECLAAIGELPEGWVLDVGCGPGRLTIPYAERHPGSLVVGLDTSPAMIAGVPAERPPNVMIGTLADAEPESFVAAWSVLVFQHIDDATACRYVDLLGVLLRPGGVFRVQFVDADRCEPGDYGPLSHPRSVETMSAWLVAAGFRVTAVDVGLVRPTWTWITGERL